MLKKIEKGDIYFFYRKKMGVTAPKKLDDVQRLYMILLPDNHKKSRLFIIGKKRMPEIHPGKSKPEEREWVMTILSTKKPEKLRDELKPVEYRTKTKGQRRQSASIPAAQGIYQIVKHKGHSEMVYEIKEPKKIGKAQRELGIRQQAGYIISVKNPKVNVPGFSNRQAKYPKSIQTRFAGLRWIDVDDPKILDYENTQILLIGARKNINDIQVSTKGKPNMFRKMKLDSKLWPTDTLKNGNFVASQTKLKAIKPRSSRTKGGRRGGKAALKTSSAAGIAKALKGISLPKNKKGIVDYANKNTDKDEIVSVLKEIPDRRFKTMADVQKAVGEVR